MNIIIIYNGLGNQMSQYAFYLQKRNIEKKTYFLTFNTGHNGYELKNVFNLEHNSIKYLKIFYLFLFKLLITTKGSLILYIIKRLLKYFNINLLSEKINYEYDSRFLESRKGINFYIGGWHCEDYFINIKHQLKHIYKFNSLLDDTNKYYLKIIKENITVSLHIRRGDFLNSSNINTYGNICTIDYYNNAVKKISQLITNPFFIIFSNDMEWVKENFKFENALYIHGNFNHNSWKDMYLMTQCKHNIIANSSFSWWAAYLNENNNRIIICPEKFTNFDNNKTNIFPKDWLRA